MKYEYETLLQHENVVMTGSDKKKIYMRYDFCC